VASRTAITRDIQNAIKRGKRSVVSKKVARKNALLSGTELKAAHDSGDELVTKIVHRAARFIGIGIGSLLNVLGPEMVVLGGGLVEAFGDDFVNRIDLTARKTAFEINSRNVRIIRTKLGDDAGVIGSAALARESLRSSAESESA